MQNEISVYIDIIFLENIIIDYAVIDISCKFSGFIAKPFKVLFGAAVGAIYAVIVCVFPILTKNVLLSLVMKLAVSTLMCIVTCGMKNKRQLLINNALIFVVSFVFAGVFIALKSLGNPITVNDGGVSLKWGESSAIYVVEMILIGYIVVSVLSFVVRKNRRLSKEVFDVEIEINCKRVTLTALCDTGNELWDKLHNLPVVVCGISSVSRLFDDDIRWKLIQQYKDGKKDDVFEVIKIFENYDMAELISVIPYNTVSNAGNDLMVGIVGNCIVKKNEQIYKRKATICFVAKKITETGGYDAILPPGIFERESIK